MKDKIYRAGIICSGFAATFLYEAIRRIFSTNVEIAGAYSANPGRLAAFTQPRGIQPYGSLQELIAASDILHICTPPSTHEQMVVDVLKQGRHVIVQKRDGHLYRPMKPGSMAISMRWMLFTGRWQWVSLLKVTAGLQVMS